MTVSSTNRKAGPYTGNGATVAFPFSFKVFSATDIAVVRADATGTETLLVLNSDYTVNLNANQDLNPGGSVGLPAALASSLTLTITSAIPNLQPTDLTNNGGFFPKVLNTTFDRLLIQIQQLAESLGRSLKTSVSTPDGVNPTLPTPVPYQLIGWNATGTGLQNTDPTYSTALATDLAASGGAEKVGFLQTGTGAVPRTLQSKERDVVSVKDFGAVGDGVANDAAAIQAAVNYVNSLTFGCSLVFPPGTYLIGTTINFVKKENVQLVVSGYGARIARFGTFTGSLLYFGEATNTTAVTPPFVLGLTLVGPYLTPVVSALVSLQNSNGILFRDCVFQSGYQAISMSNCYAVSIKDCKFANQSAYGIVSTTNCMNLIVSDCQFSDIANGRSGADIYFVAETYNISITDNDFEGGSQAVFSVAGGAQFVFRGNYVEGKGVTPPIYFGAATSSVEICGNWISYNTATQTWFNIKGGSLNYNIFWDQAQVVDPSCIDLDISHNTFAGTSNAIYRRWTVPTLGNGFTNSGAPWDIASYTKDNTGMVHLKGVVAAAVDNSPFTLPVGYRPSSDMQFSCTGIGRTLGVVRVYSTGIVTVYRSSDTSIDLSSVRFMAGG